MKSGWRAKTLGSLCAIELGKTPSRANEAFWDKKRERRHVWLSIADLLNGESTVVSDSKEYLSDKGAAISKIVRKGTLLVSFKLTLGRMAFAGCDLHTNEAIAALTILDERELSRRFLYYFLHFFDWEKAAEGDVKIKGKTLNKAKLNEISIHYPTPAEQLRIVRILDEAFEGIAIAKVNGERNVQNASALFDSYLQATFDGKNRGWRRLKINEACASIVDCVNRTAPKVAGPTPFKMIRTTNVRNGVVNLDSVNFVTESVYRLWTRRQIPMRGDVILTREAPLGEVGMILSEDKVFLGQRMVSYRADPEKLDNQYLLYALQSSDMQKQIRALASGSTVQHMRVPDSKELMIWLPPVSEQQDLVAKLNVLRRATRQLDSIYKQKLIALDNLKKSLLYQAFAGAL